MNWKSELGMKILNEFFELKESGNKMTYKQMAEYFSQKYGVNITDRSLEYALVKYGHTVRPNIEYDEEMNEEKRIRAVINEAKLKAEEEFQKKLTQQLLKERGRTELILETFRQYLQAMPAPELPPKRKIKKKPSKEEALLLFSDAQIGQKVSLEETNGLGYYDIHVFKKRMQKLVDHIKYYTHIQSAINPITKLNIFMLGDNVEGINIFKGQIHHLDVLIVDQFFEGIKTISKALIQLLDDFEEIEIWGIVGNHGRMGRKGENPTYINWDFLLYKTLEMMLVNYKDKIKWNIPLSNWTIAEIRNNSFLLLHGDTIKAWNGLPYYGIDRADSRLTAMLSAHGKKYRYLCMGHHHNPADIDSPGGEKILNGTMVGGSSFSINQLHTSSRPSQWFFGVNDRGISWRYKILLDDEDDIFNDESEDEKIKIEMTI